MMSLLTQNKYLNGNIIYSYWSQLSTQIILPGKYELGIISRHLLKVIVKSIKIYQNEISNSRRKM